MKILLASLLLLSFGLTAQATTKLTIPAGVKVEKYKYSYLPNNEPTRLSACGVYSNLSNDKIIQDMRLDSESGPFYQYLTSLKDINLVVASQSVKVEQGTDCNYRGFPSEDPDWNCSDSISGYWNLVVLSFADQYGNTWTTYDKSELVSNRSQLASSEDFIASTMEGLQKHVNNCKNF